MGTCDAVVAEARLESEAGAGAKARRIVADTLAGTAFASLIDDAILMVSELVTNAFLHGSPPVVVRVLTGDDVLRLEVEDGSHRLPMRLLPSSDAMTGRGLALVTSIASDYGVRPASHGKVIWVEVAPPDESGGEEDLGRSIDAFLAHTSDPAARDSDRRYRITLGDVPTDLLLAAKSHVDNLVREFTLAASGAASGATGAVPAHLATLIEAVTTKFAEARQSIKRQALAAAAAGAPRTHLVLTLPLSAADAGLAFLDAVEQADRYSRAARLLTLETPAEHRAFRRWYVTSLVEQLRAAARGQAPSPPRSLERYLLDTLSEVVAARRAADRAARLQSVTAALAEAATPGEVASVVVSEGVSALQASGGSLLVPLDEEHIGIPGAVGYPDELIGQLRAERRDAELPAAEAMRTGAPVWLESRAERDARYPGLIGLEPSTVSMCAVPLKVGDRILGALRFSFDQPRLFDEDERRFMLALAGQTAAALERARLFTAERQARARTTFLSEATQLLSSTLDAEQTLRHLLALLVPAFADWAVVSLLDDSGVSHPVGFSHRDPKVSALLEPSLLRFDELVVTANGRASTESGDGQNRLVTDELRERLLRDGTDPELVAALDAKVELAVSLTVPNEQVGGVRLVRVEEQPYSDEEWRIVRDLATRAAVAVSNARQYTRERQTALTLQQSLLPQRLPEVPGIDVAWRYLPGAAGALIGGDWYDVLPLDDGKVALVIGDVMGRGVQAAAIMGQLRATARAYATAHMTPATVLAHLDAAVGRLEQGQITTASFALLDPSDGTLTVASAGHLPPLLVPAGGKARFMPLEPGPPLGVGSPRYEERRVHFDPGTTLLLYTDGLVEDRTRPVDEGMELLRQAATGPVTAEQLCARALAALDRPGRHDDDTALLAVTFTGTS